MAARVRKELLCYPRRLVAHRFYRAAGGLCGLYDSCIALRQPDLSATSTPVRRCIGYDAAVGRGLRRNAEVFMARPSAFCRGACDGAYPARRGCQTCRSRRAVRRYTERRHSYAARRQRERPQPGGRYAAAFLCIIRCGTRRGYHVGYCRGSWGG